MGGGNNDAADESNDLIRKQIADQEAERKAKIKGLYDDELVSLKSQGLAQFAATPGKKTGG